MKKAISPIVAVILLIVLSVSLASILLYWGSDFIFTNTSKVDDSVSNECVGAHITINSCDYDKANQKVLVNITNIGSMDFKQDYNFNVSLIDFNKKLDTYLDVLDNNSLQVAFSEVFILEDYVGESPIELSIYNTQCPVSHWSKKCS